MKILVACEYSGRVRDAFLAQGHDAISCDLLPTDSPGPHYQGDVFDIIDNGFDLMVAHPPCTYLSNSGVRWLYNDNGTIDDERWTNMVDGAQFFKKLLSANIPRIAVENPVMHKHAREIVGERPDFTTQPWEHGETQNKRTCFWTRGLAPLRETNNVKAQMATMSYGEKNAIHHATPGPDRWKLRSTTFRGIANAIATQWGGPDVDADYERHRALMDRYGR